MNPFANLKLEGVFNKTMKMRTKVKDMLQEQVLTKEEEIEQENLMQGRILSWVEVQGLNRRKKDMYIKLVKKFHETTAANSKESRRLVLGAHGEINDADEKVNATTGNFDEVEQRIGHAAKKHLAQIEEEKIDFMQGRAF